MFLQSCGRGLPHNSAQTHKLFVLVYHCDHILDLDISKKNFHPSIQDKGGSFLEVKNSKNFTPKVVFHPKSALKSSSWLIKLLTVKVLPTQSHTKELVFLKFFFAHHFWLVGGCFWKWKFWKILTPYWIFNQTFFQNSSTFSNKSHIHSLRPMNGPRGVFYKSYY